MSQPRRRRRRRRKGSSGGAGAEGSDRQKPVRESATGQPRPHQEKAAAGRRSRRRRGRPRSDPNTQPAVRSSEDLVRAEKKPQRLTGRPDGQTLEGIIGELQSVWGVPQYPQEYRLLLKVAEKEGRVEAVAEDPPEKRAPGDGPRREKAPAPPPVVRSNGDGTPSKSRRRGRRRRRRGG